MVSADENVEEFDNLVLDDAQIEKLTVEDKEFIQEFKNLELLSFNSTKISSLANFPSLPTLKRVELADNFLKGSELSHICGNENLETLKVGGNKIATFDELKCLEVLKNLYSLDLIGNPVCELENYQEMVFEMIPSLEVLDGLNQEGDEVDSIEYGDELDGEEGEEEIEE
jgi:acidic leucine-rich nuclear phosphoprotein 32 family protein A/C/D